MKVTDAIARSDELHLRIATLDTLIYMCDESSTMKGYARVLERIKEDIYLEVQDIESKLKQIEYR